MAKTIEGVPAFKRGQRSVDELPKLPPGGRELGNAKSGQVGKVGGFGMKRSKPDFSSGGSKTNFKMDTKKGKMSW